MPRETGKKRNLRPRTNHMAKQSLSLDDCFAADEKKKRRRTIQSTAANTENQRLQAEFLGSLVGDDKGGKRPRGTLVPKWVLRIGLNSTDALVFAQLAYWLKLGNSPNQKRKLQLRWVAKSAGDLAEELHRTVNEVNHAIDRLKRRELITWETKKFSGIRQRHISIDWSNVIAAYKDATADYRSGSSSS